MKNNILLLTGVVVLYLAVSLALYGVYGASYGLFEGADRWVPDGSGGWLAQGEPSDPPPAEVSVEVPMAVQYLPIFIPALFLAVFLFTPLRRLLESPQPTEDSDVPPDAEYPPSDDSDGSRTK